MRILLLSALLACVPCFAGSPMLGSTEVEFERQFDPAGILLKGNITLSVLYGSGQWKAVYQWRTGKSLQLGYDPGLGAILLDPESGLTLSVVGIAGQKHPIDLAAEECIAKDSTTSNMQQCIASAEDLWNTQLNLNYQSLLSALDDKQKAKMRAAQRSWVLWRDAQFKANSATWPKDSGSMFDLMLGSQRAAIVREQAERLGYLANELIGANAY